MADLSRQSTPQSSSRQLHLSFISFSEAVTGLLLPRREGPGTFWSILEQGDDLVLMMLRVAFNREQQLMQEPGAEQSLAP